MIDDPGISVLYDAKQTSSKAYSALLLGIEDLVQHLPPTGTLGTADGTRNRALLCRHCELACFLSRVLYTTYLHAISHGPPLSNLGIRPHLLHVSVVVCADILEGSE